MFSGIWLTVIIGAVTLGLFVYSLLRHEKRLQETERKITMNQDKFINK